MTANADVTVYNAFYDVETRMDRYRGTVIRNVWFYVDNKVAVTADGLRSADVYKVRIPIDADTGGSQYVPPEEYSGKTGTWTIKADDYVLRGASERDIEAPAELKKHKLEAFKVTSWSDNRFGLNPHFRIGGE